MSSINQQTRPRKKSKEEKRNERLAKAQNEGAGRRKRKRIGKEKVDIETAGNQPAQPSGKGRGPKDDQAGKRGKDKKGKRKLVIANFDMTFPGLANKTNDKFHTLSVIDL